MQPHPLVKQSVKTAKRNEIVDITQAVARLVKQHRVDDGMAIVYVPHTTAAVTINENYDPDVKHDLLAKLSELVPKTETYYRHGEGNSDSHVKVAMVGSSVTVLIDGKKIFEYNEPPGVQPGNPFARKLGEGTFALQGHDPKSETHYRSVKIKLLPD